MLNANLFGVLFISCFGVIDFILQIIIDFKIQSIIPRSMIADAIYQIGVPRIYGLSEEPTYLAWYFNTLGIIAVWWLSKKKWNKLIKFILYFVIAACYFFTFSGAGIPLMIVIGLSTAFYYSKNKLKILFYATIAVFVLIVSVSSYVDYEYIEPFVNKATFKQDNEGDRGVLWKQSISDALDNPLLGKGIGYYSSVGKESPVNYFLFVFIEFGIIPLMLILSFYGIIIYKVTRYQGPAKSVMLISILCGVAHLITQSLFIHPCLWLAIIFFYKFKADNNLLENKLI